jgi:hypothetical protein
VAPLLPVLIVCLAVTVAPKPKSFNTGAKKSLIASTIFAKKSLVSPQAEKTLNPTTDRNTKIPNQNNNVVQKFHHHLS